MHQFGLNDEEVTAFGKWIIEHDRVCRLAKRENQGAVGGRFTYSFTPTSLGVVKKVTCACSEGECDLSDYESW